MDDANLKALRLSGAELAPGFHTDTTLYSATVGSAVEKVSVSWSTRDQSASCEIKGGRGQKSVAVEAGKTTEVVLVCCSEDGSNTKQYVVRVTRLSPSDATLSALAVSPGALAPAFHPRDTEYSLSIGWAVAEVTIQPTVPDPKMRLEVNGSLQSKASVSIKGGKVVVPVKVTSPDGTKCVTYSVEVRRSRPPVPFLPVDRSQFLQVMCPVCLNIVHCPVYIQGSEPRVTFCSDCLSALLKGKNIDPFTKELLQPGFRVDDEDAEKLSAALMVQCPFTFNGCQVKCPHSEMAAHFSGCPKKVEFDLSGKADGKTCDKCGKTVSGAEMSWHLANWCTSAQGSNFSLKHSVTVKSWEKPLRDLTIDDDEKLIEEELNKTLGEYFSNIPREKPDNSGNDLVRLLKRAAVLAGTWIGNRPKDAKLHFKLALILEEIHVLSDMYGVGEEGESTRDSEAVAASKEDEVNGICRLHNVPVTAGLTDKLKAIDAEYQQLKNAGNSAKADQVSLLYAWKSKQATQEGKLATSAADDCSPLGQAVQKYRDALSLDPKNADYLFNYGRMCLLMGDLEEARKVFQNNLSQRPSHVPSKAYLGICISDDPARKKEAAHFLLLGLKQKMQDQNSGRKAGFLAEDVWTDCNPATARIVAKLAALKAEWPESTIGYEEGVMFGLSGLVTGLSSIFNRRESMDQMLWLIVKTHNERLKSSSDEAERKRLIHRFGMLISGCELPASLELANIQRSVGEEAVFAHPSDSSALTLLAEAQFAYYELVSQSEADLALAVATLRAGLSLEGRSSDAAPEEAAVRSQPWFQHRLKAREEEEKRKAEEAAKAAAPAAKPAAAAPPAGRGAPAARGGASAARGGQRGAARGAPAARGAAAKPAPVPAKTPVRGAAAGRGATRGAPPARGSAVAGRGGANPHTCVGQEKPKEPEPAKEAAQPAKEEAAPKGPVQLNKKSVTARLLLARCLAKQGALEEAKKYYMETIELAPHMHDAYIEAGELLAATDPEGAVEVYSRYPFADLEEENYSDAFLHGEIVRLLMKGGRYDDGRLARHMVALGVILGKPVIQPHIDTLDAKGKYGILMHVFAGINRKPEDDPDMVQFFKLKCWL